MFKLQPPALKKQKRVVKLQGIAKRITKLPHKPTMKILKLLKKS